MEEFRLSNSPSQDGCKHEFTRAVEAPPPHYLKLVCSACGAFRAWVMKPETIQRRQLNGYRIAKLQMCDSLSLWERQFVASLAAAKKLSPKQDEVLGRLYEKYKEHKHW